MDTETGATGSMSAKSVSSLSKLLAGISLTKSIEALQVDVSKELSKPFETGVRDGVKLVALPSNISQLINDSYLVKLYITCLDLEGYEYIELKVNEHLKLKEASIVNNYLRAFGIPLASGKIPPHPKTHGTVTKGITSAVKFYLEGKKGFDISLTRVKNVAHPAIEVFGDIWGKGYPMEKRMLDHIIHYYRNTFRCSDDLTSYFLPQDVINKEKGLNLSLNEGPISSIEISLIKEILLKEDIPEKFKGDIRKCASRSEVLRFQQEISDRQTRLREFKRFLDHVTSERVTAAYQPLKSEKKTSKKRKAPISELIDDLKGTIEYSVFNPTVWLKLIKLQPLPSKTIQSDAFWDKLDQDKAVLEKQIDNLKFHTLRGSDLIAEYMNFVKSQFPDSKR
jgi:hypothetical protein